MEMASFGGKECRFVGKGHSVYVGEALNDWYARETFAGVVLLCRAAGQEALYRLHANASVLAAASPVLARLLENHACYEQEATVMLPDYHHTTVFRVLEYIYTGVVTVSGGETYVNELTNLLKEFGLEPEVDAGEYESTSLNMDASDKFVEAGDYETPLFVMEGLYCNPDVDDEVERQPAIPEKKILKTYSSGQTELNSQIINAETINNSVEPRSSSDFTRLEKVILRGENEDLAAASSSSKQRCRRPRTVPVNFSGVNFVRAEPLHYDPSPRYLQQVPVKQYTRRRITDSRLSNERLENTVRQDKIHVVSGDELNPVPSDSIFADPGEGTSAEDDEQRMEAEDLEDDEDNQRYMTRLERKKEQESFVPCDTCGKLVKLYSLKNHQKTHEVRQHACDKCGRSYTLRCQLNAHLKLQHGERLHEHPCPHCGKIFRSAKNYEDHIALHTGEKRYKYKKCEERFREKVLKNQFTNSHAVESSMETDGPARPIRDESTTDADDQSEADFRSDTPIGGATGGKPGEIPVFLPCLDCTEVFTTFRDYRRHRWQAHDQKK